MINIKKCINDWEMEHKLAHEKNDLVFKNIINKYFINNNWW
jgi:hypothetical protein